MARPDFDVGNLCHTWGRYRQHPMSRIPQHFIDDLMARVDIVEIVGARVQLKKAGREYKACCPFHDEKTPSFTVSPTKQFYHCFGCGAHGTALSFLMDHDHLGFVDAVEELARQAGIDVPREAGPEAKRAGDDLYAVMDKAARYFCRELKGSAEAIEYLKNRGVDGETAAKFGIGFAPHRWDGLIKHVGATESALKQLADCGLIIEREQGGWYDRFRGRVMFPIRDARGRVIAFGGRIIGDGEPKYLNSPETRLFHKGRELYGLFEARQALRDIPRLMVVEGYMDVVGLSQAGIHWSVATLGTATTSEHLHRLFRLTDTVVFCFDGDRAGRQAAWRALENALPGLTEGRQIQFLFLPEGEDPDSLVRAEGAERFQGRVDEAVPLSDYLLEHLQSQVDMETMDGRARMAELARPLLSRIPAGIYHDLLVARLAQVIGMNEERLEKILAGDLPRQPGFRPAARGTPRPASPRSSLVRQAIALVLHHPRSAAVADIPEGLAQVDLKGVPLLSELLEICTNSPDISTAGLLERWRDRKEHPHLLSLAAGDLLVSDEAAPIVIGDTLRQIVRRAGPERRTEALLTKARGEGLTPAEKEELRDLLAGRADAGTGNRDAR
jgi:DNA primase